MLFGNRIRTHALLSAAFRTGPQHRVDLGSAHVSANTFLNEEVVYNMDIEAYSVFRIHISAK